MIDRQRLALGSGIAVHINGSPHKLCSDLNRQPKRPGDFDLENGVGVLCDVGCQF